MFNPTFDLYTALARDNLVSGCTGSLTMPLATGVSSSKDSATAMDDVVRRLSRLEEILTLGDIDQQQQVFSASLIRMKQSISDVGTSRPADVPPQGAATGDVADRSSVVPPP
jgi:hypothetical protein